MDRSVESDPYLPLLFLISISSILFYASSVSYLDKNSYTNLFSISLEVFVMDNPPSAVQHNSDGRLSPTLFIVSITSSKGITELKLVINQCPRPHLNPLSQLTETNIYLRVYQVTSKLL